MSKCKNCGSYAINHHAHGRDGSDGHLCDVCYWRRRAEQDGARQPLTDEQITEIWAAKVRYHAAPIGSTDLEFARDIERAHGIGIKKENGHGLTT